jgi:hypothetical protein
MRKEELDGVVFAARCSRGDGDPVAAAIIQLADERDAERRAAHAAQCQCAEALANVEILKREILAMTKQAAEARA